MQMNSMVKADQAHNLYMQPSSYCYVIPYYSSNPVTPLPTLLAYAYKIPSYRICHFPHCQRTGQYKEGQSQGTWGSVFPVPSVCKTKENFRQ